MPDVGGAYVCCGSSLCSLPDMENLHWRSVLFLWMLAFRAFDGEQLLQEVSMP